VATKLSATLSQEQMRQDAKLEWVTFSGVWESPYSHRGAAIMAVNWTLGLLVPGLALVALVSRLKPQWRVRLVNAGLAMTLTGLLAGSGWYLSVPKTGVRLVQFPGIQARSHLYDLYSEIERASAGTPEAAHRVLASARTNGMPENLLLGGQVHEEDSPGNFTLRATTNGLEYLIYDAQGAVSMLPH
jgi:hypothetical protein